MPGERLTQQCDVLARDRMIHAEPRRGAPSHPGPSLYARVGGHQATSVRQALHLTVLACGRLLGHHRLPVAEQRA